MSQAVISSMSMSRYDDNLDRNLTSCQQVPHATRQQALASHMLSGPPAGCNIIRPSGTFWLGDAIEMTRLRDAPYVINNGTTLRFPSCILTLLYQSNSLPGVASALQHCSPTAQSYSNSHPPSKLQCRPNIRLSRRHRAIVGRNRLWSGSRFPFKRYFRRVSEPSVAASYHQYPELV